MNYDEKNHLDFTRYYDKIITFFYIRDLIRYLRDYLKHYSQYLIYQIRRHKLYKSL